MPEFAYQGRTASGKLLRGNMEAPSREAVINRLRAQRIQPINNKIKERGKGLDREIALPTIGNPVKPNDVVIFTRQLTTMIDAGMPLVQILDILGTQTDNRAFGRQILEVKEAVESGASLSDALRMHPKTFDELYTNMVQAGEVGGILDSILGRLSIYMEKMISLRRQIKGAMIYPVTIIGVAVIVTLILLVFVIPVFAELFTSFGQALPLPTQIVITLSNFTVSYLHILLGGAFLIAIGIRQIYRTERGRFFMDKAMLRFPVLGELLRKASIARFSRTLGTLVSSGVPILDALTITAKTAGNKVVEKAGFMVRESIREGRTMAEPLIASGVFPPMVCQMIGAGEMTGAIDQMLQKIADFYEEEVDTAVANMTALMEPLVIVILGTVIGGLVIAMYLPIFQLGSLLSS